MSKSHAKELSMVYDSLFKDLKYAFPTLRAEFDRDRIRLAIAVNCRGVGVYYSDLPALGKHLDRCLASGQFKPPEIALSRRYSGRVVIPKLFRGLYQLIFDGNGAMRSNCDVEAIKLLRQAYYLAKRAKVDCSVHAVQHEVCSFVETDVSLPDPESFWDSEVCSEVDVGTTYQGFVNSEVYQQRLIRMGESSRVKARLMSELLGNLDVVSGLLTSFMGKLPATSELTYRHGPGAVSDPGGCVNKYAFTNWSDRLEREFAYADCGFHNHAAWARHMRATDGGKGIDARDPYSKLIAVPKTYTKPRLIAAEPSEHQWCQQALRHWMYERVAKTWISEFVRFRDQTMNQELCRKGSTDGTLATVDLSAASDRVSCHFVGQLLRGNPKLLLCLQSSRSSHVSIPDELLPQDWRTPYDHFAWFPRFGLRKGPSGIELRLKKFSTMGNACTFPVESLGFLAVTLAACLTARRWKPRLRNILRLVGEVAVFGDDIIVPEDSRELLFDALEILDFKVNLDKSFWTGLFRESCGMDAYAGVDVTPAYWRAPNDGKPESLASSVEVSNNFYERFLVNTANCVARTVPLSIPRGVPFGSGLQGLKSFVAAPPLAFLKCRWNRELQRHELKAMAVSAKVESVALRDETALLQFFTELPDPSTEWSGGVRSLPVLRTKHRWVALSNWASSCPANKV